MADEKKSTLDTALPWLALAAGVGGVAYMASRPGAKKPAAAASPMGEGSATKRRRKKRRKAKAAPALGPDGQPLPEEKRPMGEYAAFVKQQMPLLKKQGVAPGDAMKKISEKWQAKKGKA